MNKPLKKVGVIVAMAAMTMGGLAFSFAGANPVKAAAYCQCTTYVANRYELPSNYPNANLWNDGYLANNGFVQTSPYPGLIVVMENTFPGADPVAGHVGVLDSYNPATGMITLRGANQTVGDPFFEEAGCNNVRFTAFGTSIAGRTDISFWEKYSLPPVPAYQFSNLDEITETSFTPVGTSTNLQVQATRKSDNGIYTRYKTSTGWNAWQKAGPIGAAARTNIAMASSNGILYQVIAGTTNGDLYVRNTIAGANWNGITSDSNLWTGWTPLSGSTMGDISLVSVNNILILTVKGDSSYSTKYFRSGGWSPTWEVSGAGVSNVKSKVFGGTVYQAIVGADTKEGFVRYGNYNSALPNKIEWVQSWKSIGGGFTSDINLEYFNLRIYVAGRGMTGGDDFYKSISANASTDWNDNQHNPWISTGGKSAGEVTLGTGVVSGAMKLYFGVIGDDSSRMAYIRSFDGTKFVETTWQNIGAASSDISLLNVANTLNITLKGKDDSSLIYTKTLTTGWISTQLI